jgi:hypothetical protein
MHMATEIVLAASAVVAAAGMVGILLELKSLRTFLARGSLSVEVTRLPKGEPLGSQSARPDRPRDGYAIYVYRGTKWVLEHDLSAPGFRPVPPRLDGAYEGQAIRVAATAEAPSSR